MMKLFFILFSFSAALYAEEKPKSIEIIFWNDVFKPFNQPKDEKYFLIYKGTLVTRFSSMNSIQTGNVSTGVGALEHWEKKIGPVAKELKETVRKVPLANLPELELKKDDVIHLYDSVLDKNVNFKVLSELVISLIRTPFDGDAFYATFNISSKNQKSTPRLSLKDEWGGGKKIITCLMDLDIRATA